MTNFKVLCAELVHIANALDGKNALISNQGQAMDGYSALAAFRDVANRARALLAEADGPAVPEGREPASVVDNIDVFAFARAVLARYGHQPAPPAEGEVK
jgi:hypothetical protein